MVIWTVAKNLNTPEVTQKLEFSEYKAWYKYSGENVKRTSDRAQAENVIKIGGCSCTCT
jgi:hypothetical protein